MSSASASVASVADSGGIHGRPDIHLWLSIEEASTRLGVPAPLIHEQVARGEIEARVGSDGMREVFVRLPHRCVPGDRFEPIAISIVPDELPASEERTAFDPDPVAISPTLSRGGELMVQPVRPSVEQMLVPMMQALRWQQAPAEIRRSRRAARVGWAAAGVMLGIACAASAFTTRVLLVTHSRLQSMSNRLNRMSEAASTLAAERNQLRGQLVESRQAVGRVQDELAVDRKIEETLIKAALAARAARNNEPARQALAGAQ